MLVCVLMLMLVCVGVCVELCCVVLLMEREERESDVREIIGMEGVQGSYLILI